MEKKTADDELWRVSPSFPDYEVSSKGRVRRATAKRGTRVGRMLAPTPGVDGYYRVQPYPSTSSRLVHRLVAEAFLDPPQDGQDSVAHYDGDKRNNAVTNLRWVTRKENEQDKLRHGTHQFGENNKQARLTEVDVRQIRELHATGTETCCSLGERFGTRHQNISKIVNRLRWQHVE